MRTCSRARGALVAKAPPPLARAFWCRLNLSANRCHLPVNTVIAGFRLFVVPDSALQWTTAISNYAVVRHAGSVSFPFPFLFLAAANRRRVVCSASQPRCHRRRRHRRHR